MKNRLKATIIFTIFVISTLFSFYAVQAYSGEVDPNDYINTPTTIYIENRIGTGTVTLSPEAVGYKIYYQKVDITEEKKNEIIAKYEAANSHLEKSNEEIRKKEEKLTSLQEEYNNALKENKSEAEISRIETEIQNARNDYEEYYETARQKFEELKKEYYDQIPNYTNSWTETTIGENNITLDFSSYEGSVNFYLWVKIDNGTNTYYDFAGFSTEVKDKSEEQKPSEEDPEEDPGQKPGDNTNPTDEGTDFSKASFKLVKSGVSKAIIEISGASAPVSASSQFIYIRNNPNEPSITNNVDDDRIVITYDSNTKTYKTVDTQKVAEKVELNQDLYVSVLEKRGLNESIRIYGKKVERFSEAKYSDAFHATFMTYKDDQIITNFTHAEENNRRMQIKIGKITDQSILQKIKNQDSSGFSSLLSYAKSNSGMYDETLDADKDDNFAIEYNAGNDGKVGNKVIDLKNLEDNQYYYLYVKTTDENGKYVSNEAVTLAQADIIDSKTWYLFFYGSSDFKWADFGAANTTPTDNTTANKALPNTGSDIIVFAITMLFVAGGGLILYKKYNNYNY